MHRLALRSTLLVIHQQRNIVSEELTDCIGSASNPALDDPFYLTPPSTLRSLPIHYIDLFCLFTR